MLKIKRSAVDPEWNSRTKLGLLGVKTDTRNNQKECQGKFSLVQNTTTQDCGNQDALGRWCYRWNLTLSTGETHNTFWSKIFPTEVNASYHMQDY